jgi:hypothetical protein
MFQRFVVLITLGWMFYFFVRAAGLDNWFSSYVYDSPEVPEQVVDHNGGNSGEAQDLLEVIVIIIILLSSINHIPADWLGASRAPVSSAIVISVISTRAGW